MKRRKEKEEKGWESEKMWKRIRRRLKSWYKTEETAMGKEEE